MNSPDQNQSKESKRNRLAYLEGLVSIFVNTVLFVLKYWAGIVSGSVALIADAWHTLSDSISSIIVMLGVKLSSKKPNRKHPFGHGRWEQIAAIFIGFLLAIVAYEFIREAIEKFKNHESAVFGTTAIVVTVLSILFKEGLARFAFYIGKRTENLSVKADAWHHRSDAFSSLLVLIGLFLNKYFWWMDSALSFLIAGLLFYAAFGIVKEAIEKILGEGISDELKTSILDLIRKNYEHDYHAHHFHLHNYGNHRELTFHVVMDENTKIGEAHDIANGIEQVLLNELNISATIHIDPRGVAD